MNISTQDRGTLKSYFKHNDIPTEGQFAELIDGMLNQRDDGVVRPAGDVLSLWSPAGGDSRQPVLKIYHGWEDHEAAWVLSLKPRADPADPATARRGLALGTAAGESRLFIDEASGNVGIGTVEPEVTLDVRGQARIEQESWHRVTAFENGWRNSRRGNVNPAGYFKDSLGIVHLRGMLLVGKRSSNKTIFILPEGYRPENVEMQAAMSFHQPPRKEGAYRAGLIGILPDGQVQPIWHGDQWVSLDGISFRAARGEDRGER